MDNFTEIKAIHYETGKPVKIEISEWIISPIFLKHPGFDEMPGSYILHPD